VRISDFGVSVWFSVNGQIKKKPHYIGEGKDMYLLADEENEETTYHFKYDIRLKIISRFSPTNCFM